MTDAEQELRREFCKLVPRLASSSWNLIVEIEKHLPPSQMPAPVESARLKFAAAMADFVVWLRKASCEEDLAALPFDRREARP